MIDENHWYKSREGWFVGMCQGLLEQHANLRIRPVVAMEGGGGGGGGGGEGVRECAFTVKGRVGIVEVTCGECEVCFGAKESNIDNIE